eukprot:4169816-Ditylum_brightwellii.AAC.1
MNVIKMYQEVNANTHHIHMNVTKWMTLGDLCSTWGNLPNMMCGRDRAGVEKEYRKHLECEKLNEEQERKKSEVRRMGAAKVFDWIQLDEIGTGSRGEIVKATSVLDRGDDGMRSVKMTLGGVNLNAALKWKHDGVKKAIQNLRWMQMMMMMM